MTGRRVFHVVEATAGALGAGSTVRRLPGRYRTAAAAEKRKPRNDGRRVYFVEWEWVAIVAHQGESA